MRRDSDANLVHARSTVAAYMRAHDVGTRDGRVAVRRALAADVRDVWARTDVRDADVRAAREAWADAWTREARVTWARYAARAV